MAPRGKLSQAAPRGFPASCLREETREFPIAEVCWAKPPRERPSEPLQRFRMWSLRRLQIFPRVLSTCHLKIKLHLSDSGGAPQTQPPKATQSIFTLLHFPPGCRNIPQFPGLSQLSGWKRATPLPPETAQFYKWGQII